jgi:hypothetical protein
MAAKPGEHKTVQARILAYAQEIGWTYVSRAEAQTRRGFDTTKETPAEQATDASPYFDDLLDTQMRAFNSKYADGPGALVGELRHLHATIAGNRDFLVYLRNGRTFYDKEAGRELNLVVIDYENAERNVFEVTEEFYCHNGKHGTREDVVFLINGIPVLVIECKNATKDEAIALGVDHLTTPKNHQRRRIDLSRQLQTGLRLWRRQQQRAWLAVGQPRPDWVFASVAGTALDESNVRKMFNRILDAAGLRRRGPHQMRHSFASQLLAAGEPITYVSQQLGHGDASITLRVYAHWLPDTTARKGVDRLDETAPDGAQTAPRAIAVNQKTRLSLLDGVVSRLGIEPRTRRLRVCCSAN